MNMTETAIRKKTEVSAGGRTITVKSLHHLGRYWREGSQLKWDCLFMLPPWLGVWCPFFGRSAEPRLYIARHNDAIPGIVPLLTNGRTARLISDSDLIDYSDFIVSPSMERDFFSTLFDHFRRKDIDRFEISRIREDSTAVSYLRRHSAALGCRISCKPVDLLYEMELPDTWEGYLTLLSGKERHETRRKLRRLESAGNIGVRVIEHKKDVSDAMDTFTALFRANRIEKARFMTGDVELFFRRLAVEMAAFGLLKLFFLDLDNTPVAAAMCFDYQSTFYLYNNGYDQRFDHLSVGLMSKVLSIRESIALGRKKYNFLRGSETYKGHLGGRPVRLLRCEVILK